MMKRLMFLISFFYVLTAQSQNYQISFAGTGASNSVSTVKVENLTKGASLIINGNYVLCLMLMTGIVSIKDINTSVIKIYESND
jgi:hypothetical protein